jgi:peptidoglycan/xylan/chitin deacetylase (PgdA/CDA1 family)
MSSIMIWSASRLSASNKTAYRIFHALLQAFLPGKAHGYCGEPCFRRVGKAQRAHAAPTSGAAWRARFALPTLLLLLAGNVCLAQERAIEIHQRLVVPADAASKTVALTLDACGGQFDAGLIAFLVDRKIPATIFVTKKWLDRNWQGLAALRANKDLFQIENHGARHLPALLGAGRKVYGIAGVGDIAGLAKEVQGGADAVKAATGVAPGWYRGATALYEPAAISAIEKMGYKIAGFSVNADAGATLSKAAVAARVAKVVNGDILIAHVNKPQSQTAAGLKIALPKLQAQGVRFVLLRDVAQQTIK